MPVHTACARSPRIRGTAIASPAPLASGPPLPGGSGVSHLEPCSTCGRACCTPCIMCRGAGQRDFTAISQRTRCSKSISVLHYGWATGRRRPPPIGSHRTHLHRLPPRPDIHTRPLPVRCILHHCPCPFLTLFTPVRRPLPDCVHTFPQASSSRRSHLCPLPRPVHTCPPGLFFTLLARESSRSRRRRITAARHSAAAAAAAQLLTPDGLSARMRALLQV